MKTFRETVKAARAQKGLTLLKVARAIGSHKGYISGIEHGKVNPPSAKLVVKLAKVLDLDDQELLSLAVLAKLPRALKLSNLQEVLNRMLRDSKEPVPTLSVPTTAPRTGNV